MTIQTPYETSKAKAELIDELTKVIKMQIHGSMDWVRSRAYWDSKLPGVDPVILAEALTDALSIAASEVANRA
ncbi:hypothetical protein [Pectobacterium sp. B1J-3]|uniref:hypothetical protein n=1 Tax=Pectobacterium sp. B1J-3 TaxID=3385371 RepID=UPI0039069600